MCDFRQGVVKPTIRTRKKLYEILEKKIIEGNSVFLIRARGSFNSIAYSIFNNLKKKYPMIELILVYTEMKQFLNSQIKIFGNYSNSSIYSTIYDIEEIEHQQREFVSEKKMIEDCDEVIMYVNSNSNGNTHLLLEYAKNLNKDICCLEC